MALFKSAYLEALKGVRLTQGKVKEARPMTPCFDDVLPPDARERIYAWLRDGWGGSEAEVRGDARNAGPHSPTVFVFLPARHRNELRAAIIEHKAAHLTLERRGTPSTPEGQDARSAMETRRNDAARRIRQFLQEIFADAQVYQGGGQTVDGDPLAARLQAAGEAAMVRLYPDFDTADRLGWDKVVEHARKADTQALRAVQFNDDADKHPVCSAVLKYLGAGRKGSEVRDHFRAPPYGWPQDAIDGALYALTASGHVLALNALGRQVDARELDRKQLTLTHFKPETVTVSPVQKIQIRKLFQEAGVSCQPNQEPERTPELLRALRELAIRAGGEAPKPATPDMAVLERLEALSGNALLAELYARRDALIKLIEDWQDRGKRIDQHWPTWTLLQELLAHACDLGPYADLQQEAEAIAAQRALLAAHDPVQALLGKTVDLLRHGLHHHVEAHRQARDDGLAELAQDGQWQRLSAGQRAEILSRYHLNDDLDADLSSPESLLDELETCSLAHWADRTQALEGRFEQARIEAARLLQPRVVPVSLPKRTLASEQELRDWLQEVEGRILEKLKDGPVMV
jgi:hypothetical protein